MSLKYYSAVFAIISALAGFVHAEMVPLDISGGYNRDGYVSSSEWNEAESYNPPGDWGLGGRTIGYVFGENDSPYIWQGEVAGSPLDGFPTNGVVATSYGAFWLAPAWGVRLDREDLANAKTAQKFDNPEYDKPTNPYGLFQLASNVVYAYRGHTGGASPTAKVYIPLPPGQRGRYTDINFLISGDNLDNGKALIYAAYDNGTGGSNLVVIYNTPGPAGAGEIGFPSPVDTSSTNTDIVEVVSLQQGHCWAEAGGPPFTYMKTASARVWTFNAPIPLDSSKTLVGLVLAVYDEDIYRARWVTMYAATATAAAELAPSIAMQPIDQYVTLGQAATFAVTADGTPPLTYQWRSNSAWISDATNDSYTTPGMTEGADGTGFDVIVANGVGAVTSVVATLHLNQPPSVSLTDPVSGASFMTGAGATLMAMASDSGGSVTNVAFYAGATKLADDASSPYSYFWSGMAEGDYALKAVATDNHGAMATSAVVNVTATSWHTTNIWLGANTPAGNSTQVWVDDPALWSLGWVPTNGDTAIFNYEYANINDIHIDGTNLFAPSSLIFNANQGSESYAQSKSLYLDKSLTLSNLILTTYPDSGGARNTARLRLGTISPVTLALTGNGEALNIAGGGAINAMWSAIMVGNASSVIDFQGTNITFSTGAQLNTTDYLDPAAWNLLDDATGASNSVIKFSADKATIHLAGQGLRGATLGVGQNNLQVSTGQTWTAEATAFASFIYRFGSSGAGPEIVQCLNGPRLDNLGELNIALGRVLFVDVTTTTKATGMRLLGGTYGSLRLAMGTTVVRDGYVVLKGDVTLKGRAVMPPADASTPAAVTEDSLLIDTGVGIFGNSYYLDTDGYALSLSNGLRVLERSDATHGSQVILSVTGSTVTVGGNLVIHSDSHGPWAATNAIWVNRNMGFQGDAGTVLNLRGHYSNNCASCLASYAPAGLTLSTVNLVGGSDWKTFEVGDAVTNTTFRAGSFAVGTFNVGDGSSRGWVRLVNSFLNDNPTAYDMAGEKLTVSNLNIKASSMLDINGQAVEIHGDLAIEGNASLDLNTRATLAVSQVITNVYAIGNRTNQWDAVASRVRDRGTSNAIFGSTYDAGEGKTYWKVMALPQGTVFTLR